MNRLDTDGLHTFIADVELVLTSTDDEHEITTQVAERMSDLLARGYRLPPPVTRPSPVRHMTYPLYIAPDDSWSMASVVWDVGGTRTRGPIPQAGCTGEAHWFVSGWDGSVARGFSGVSDRT